MVITIWNLEYRPHKRKRNITECPEREKNREMDRKTGRQTDMTYKGARKRRESTLSGELWSVH